MNIDEYGQVLITPEELFEGLYSGKIKSLESIFVDKETAEQFNKIKNFNKDNFESLQIYKKPEESIEFFDEANQCDWFMPKEYLEFPLEQWLIDQCKTEDEQKRVREELALFIQHGMFDLLFYLKYLVDTMRENKIVWGVGRGSSVASYVLYLLGVHKINSIKYDLDIREFLK